MPETFGRFLIKPIRTKVLGQAFSLVANNKVAGNKDNRRVTQTDEAGSAPVPNANAPEVGLLRADLAAADWTVTKVESLLSDAALRALERGELVPGILELEDATAPAAILTRLFLFAQTLPKNQIKVAFRTLTLSGALKLGLIRESGSGEDGSAQYQAVIDLRPYTYTAPSPGTLPSGENIQRTHNWWVASDLSQAQTNRPPHTDHVLGIASASSNLLRLTVREPVERALDLGCGSGILALHLSTHSGEVVATDISLRACEFTRLNAALNSIDLDVRVGSLYEPVEGETFDLITSNPPFVITPQSVREEVRLPYRDGGVERDNLMPQVIEGALAHLNEGGLLQMLANWEVRGGAKAWESRATGWIERAAAGMTVDAWVVQRDLVDSYQYAEWWMKDAWGESVPPQQWNRVYRKWIADFKSAQVDYVGLGFIALRSWGTKAEDAGPSKSQSDTENRHFTEQMREERSASGGLTLVCEYLPDGPPADGRAVTVALNNLKVPSNWLDRPLVRGSDVREARYLIPGEVDPELIQLTQGRAGGRTRTASSMLAALVGVADGQMTPRQAIPAIAYLLDLETIDVVEHITIALPELLRSGLLEFGAIPT